MFRRKPLLLIGYSLERKYLRLSVESVLGIIAFSTHPSSETRLLVDLICYNRSMYGLMMKVLLYNSCRLPTITVMRVDETYGSRAVKGCFVVRQI